MRMLQNQRGQDMVVGVDEALHTRQVTKFAGHVGQQGNIKDDEGHAVDWGREGMVLVESGQTYHPIGALGPRG